MLEITSKNNEKLKLLTAVRDFAAERKASGLCFAEGLRLCRDAARTGAVERLFVTREALSAHPEIVSWGVCPVIIEGAAARKISDTRNGQEIFALCRAKPEPFEAKDLARGRYLFLDGVCDPGNMGVIIRTAEAFALDGVIIHKGCDPFSPKALRAGMGGTFRQRIFSCTDAEPALLTLKERGFYLAAGVVSPGAEPAEDAEKNNAAVLCIGSEADGVSQAVAKHCKGITLRMKGRAESLNAACAASVLMWELFGRREG